MTKIAPTAYVPPGVPFRSARLDRFLGTFLPADTDDGRAERDYLLGSLAVAALSAGNADRALLLLLGPSTTGKTTLAGLLTTTLGKHYVSTVDASAFRGNLDDRPRPDLRKFIEARLALGFEADRGWQLHAGQVKRMTGGDPVSYRAMRSDVFVERIPEATPIIIANHPPMITRVDDATRRRLRVMIMGHAAPDDGGEQRAALLADPDAKAALLQILVGHYAALGGKLPAAERIPWRFAEATMGVFAALDDVHAMLAELVDDEQLVADAAAPLSRCVRAEALYRTYARRARDGGVQRLSYPEFKDRLADLRYSIGRSNGMRVVGLVPGEQTDDRLKFLWTDV